MNLPGGIRKVAQLWDAVREVLFASDLDKAERELRHQARAAAPVLWLLGKTGAGKTAIVSALTGDPRAEVGQGYQPCTRLAAFYDVPEEAPFLRFLDTRGLEEAGYDPTEDIAWCEGQAHLLLAVMQVDDPAQEVVLRVIRQARKRHPDWPLVVAQTGLHRRYPPGRNHAVPFVEAEAPEALRDSLAYQRQLFRDVPGDSPPVFVPIDFTQEGDGLEPRDYRLEALDSALESALPDALAALHAARAGEGDDRRQKAARRTIYAYTALAAGAGAVPVPLAGMAGLAALQGAMLHRLASRYQVEWTPGLFGAFAGSLGIGTAGWFGLRYLVAEAAKVVPVLGTAAGVALNAGSAAAFTAGTGEAALVFLRAVRAGQSAPAAEVREAYRRAFRNWRERPR
ncbi:YcjF family protein [Roseococcus sp. YIM B11640]|uniref:YcjF family protein n=1 Tax=Roseococcus sp. YIM B11640 TaxID=3133973 RepID=UPI003C7B89A1